MSIEVTMSGSGSIGDIAPGWSVNEYATPVTIGETSGGTGNVSFNAASLPDSLFVINNTVTTSHDMLGSVSGVVKSVSQTGLDVSVGHTTALNIFDANRNIPPLGAGGIGPALDLCNQLSGRQSLLADGFTGHFYSMYGHSAGFDELGNIVESTASNGTYFSYNNSDGITYLVHFRQQYGTVWGSNFVQLNNNVWASSVAGDSFSNTLDAKTSRLAFKTILNGSDFYFGFSGEPDNSDSGQGQQINFRFDYSENMFTIYGRYRQGGILRSFSQVYDMGSQLDKDSEFAVFVEYTRPGFSGGDYVYTVKVCNTSNYDIVASLTETLTNAAISSFNSPWLINGLVRSVYRNQGNNLGDWVAEFEKEKTISVSTSLTVNGPVAAQPDSNMWEYLQAACSAYACEIAAYDGVIVARNISTIELDITNKTVPTVSPTILFAGRNVEIEYTNARNIVREEIYDAYADGNRVLSVKADETVTTTLDVSGTPVFLDLPSPSKSPRNGVGEYALISEDNIPVPYNLWSDAGGRVDVTINPNNPNAIDVILTGPSSSFIYSGGTPFGGATPAYKGPFKLAYSDGGTDYAALSVTGTGVATKPQKLRLHTAADHLKVAQDVAKTIVNPFIASKGMVYDRGEWAVVNASGPQVKLSASVPVSSVQGFGFVAGAIVKYRDSIYRIVDATVNDLTVSFNALRHVTVEDFDNFWAGRTVGTHDELWSGYETADQIIAPLRFIGDDESVMMFLDTDVNPYYDFTGEPEISVFPDIDHNPYYEMGGRIDGEDEVRLDTDTNPYDDGDGYGS